MEFLATGLGLAQLQASLDICRVNQWLGTLCFCFSLSIKKSGGGGEECDVKKEISEIK